MAKTIEIPPTGPTPQFIKGVGNATAWRAKKVDCGFINPAKGSVCVANKFKYHSKGGKDTLDLYVVVALTHLDVDGKSKLDRWMALDPDAAVSFATEILEQATNARYARDANPLFGEEE